MTLSRSAAHAVHGPFPTPLTMPCHQALMRASAQHSGWCCHDTPHPKCRHAEQPTDVVQHGPRASHCAANRPSGPGPRHRFSSGRRSEPRLDAAAARFTPAKTGWKPRPLQVKPSGAQRRNTLPPFPYLTDEQLTHSRWETTIAGYRLSDVVVPAAAVF
jgi:hypothetical protein